MMRISIRGASAPLHMPVRNLGPNDTEIGVVTHYSIVLEISFSWMSDRAFMSLVTASCMQRAGNYSGSMEMEDAIPVLSALAQATRYRCVSHLIDQGECTAGDLALVLDVPANTMSSHLTILAHAGLVTSQRHGRNIVYAACVGKIADVAGMLSALIPDQP